MKEFEKLKKAFLRECLIKTDDPFWYASSIEEVMKNNDSYTASCVGIDNEYFLIHADSSGNFYFKIGVLTTIRNSSELTITIRKK